MSKFYTGAVLTAMLGASVAGLSPTAARATTISIGDSLNGGAITTLATDGGSGLVQAHGSDGIFTTISASATGYPALTQPNLDTSSIDVSSSGSGVLEVFITETGLSSPQGIASFLSSFTFQQFSGTGIVSVVEKTFISAANALYSGTLLASDTDTAGVLQTSKQLANSPALHGLFSETVEYIITTSGIGDTNDTVNLSVPVPEPATFGIFGIGLALMTMMAWRRRSL